MAVAIYHICRQSTFSWFLGCFSCSWTDEWFHWNSHRFSRPSLCHCNLRHGRIVWNSGRTSKSESPLTPNPGILSRAGWERPAVVFQIATCFGCFSEEWWLLILLILLRCPAVVVVVDTEDEKLPLHLTWKELSQPTKAHRKAHRPMNQLRQQQSCTAGRRTGARQPRQLSVWNYGWKKRQAGGKGCHPSNIPLTLNDSMMNAWIGSIKLFFTREFICLPETISEVRAGASQLSVKPHSHIRTATACHRCCRQLRFGGASTSSHPKMMASVRRKRSSRELHGLLNFATMETAFSWVK